MKKFMIILAWFMPARVQKCWGIYSTPISPSYHREQPSIKNSQGLVCCYRSPGTLQKELS